MKKFFKLQSFIHRISAVFFSLLALSVFVGQNCLAEARINNVLDLRGLKIKVVDSQGTVVPNVAVKFQLSFDRVRPGIECLYPDSLWSSGAFSCPFPEEEAPFFKSTESDGYVKFDLDSGSYFRRWFTRGMYFTVSFNTKTTPKCFGLNYFQRFHSDITKKLNLDDFVYDQTIRIHPHNLLDLKSKNSSEIVCVL